MDNIFQCSICLYLQFILYLHEYPQLIIIYRYFLYTLAFYFSSLNFTLKILMVSSVKGWGDGLVRKCSSCRHKYSVQCESLCKKAGVVVSACNPSIEEGQTDTSLRKSLVYLLSSKPVKTSI